MDAIASSAVELKNVARRFVTPSGEILSALEDFDLSIAPGEFFAIVGPTGCGKSTTLGLIAGLAKPQGGEVTLFDAPVDGVDRRVGFVFQQDAVFPWRNVLGNVMAGPLFRGVPKARAEEMARSSDILSVLSVASATFCGPGAWPAKTTRTSTWHKISSVLT